MEYTFCLPTNCLFVTVAYRIRVGIEIRHLKLPDRLFQEAPGEKTRTISEQFPWARHRAKFLLATKTHPFLPGVSIVYIKYGNEVY